MSTSVVTEHQFPPKFVEGIVAHLNAEHQSELLVIAHGIAGQSWAQAATLRRVDKLGLDMALSAPAEEKDVRVLFDAPLETTVQFRPAMIALIQRAQQCD